MRPAFPILLFLFLAFRPAPSQTVRCGTAQWFQYLHQHKGARAGGAAKTAVVAAPAFRTLETDHFSLHYSLRGIHRIKTTPADSLLLHLLDSLYVSVSGMPTDSRDAAVIAALDAISAPQPVFAATMADFFEKARDYYVTHLGMKAPRIAVPSNFYRAPAPPLGKYAVDIVDVYRAAKDGPAQFSDVDPKTYALTFPPSGGGMLIENDFLFNTTLDPTGNLPMGDTLKSCYPTICENGGTVIRDYGVEWEAGLKVTCFHEFYHAVQFTYTPEPDDFHVWYETGAVGMEERNAPEVNDYLQYLPGFFRNLSRVSMFDYPVLSTDSWYGNGIFHLYLTRTLGEDFDVGVWARLEANGNDIRDALPNQFMAHGKTVGQVYSGFAAQLAFSGRTEPAPFPLFSPDMPLWPRLQTQSADLAAATDATTQAQPPLTISALRLAGLGATHKGLFLEDPNLVPVLAKLGADSSRVEFPDASPFPFGPSDSAGRETLLILANASLTKTNQAQFRIFQSLASQTLFAYPNPFARAASAGPLFFSHGSAAVAISIYSEDGRPVRKLDFTPEAPLWSWDLKDETGKPAEAGLYYYKSEGRLLSPLVLQ
ncbi:MAG: hypothetical protein JWO30_1471 [Fibrobacteres bacterium]|nr:hypothetical protein [Fibrobacterota bacterium]